MYTIFRLLLVPIFGGFVSSGASDVVRYVREDAKAVKNAQGVSGLEKARKKNG